MFVITPSERFAGWSACWHLYPITRFRCRLRHYRSRGEVSVLRRFFRTQHFAGGGVLFGNGREIGSIVVAVIDIGSPLGARSMHGRHLEVFNRDV